MVEKALAATAVVCAGHLKLDAGSCCVAIGKPQPLQPKEFRVATVREKSGKNKNFSRSGKSQGILQKVMENLSSCQSQ